MVIAEVPLWVTHRDTTAANGRGASGHRNGNNDSATAAAAAMEGEKAGASASWSLLHEHARNKCAIYSVDVHPHSPAQKFATAGGDGTVRIWSTASLFASNHRGGHFEEEQAAPAGYVSTSNSESSNCGNDEDMRSKGSETNGVKAKSKSSSRGSGRSSSSSSEEEIYDLNQFVRRKQQNRTEENYNTANWGGSLQRSNKNNITTPARTSPTPKYSISANKHIKHRLLCTLTAHTGSSVLCVRWSNSGQFLASAGDDGCVCIYAQTSSSTPGLATGNLVDTPTVAAGTGSPSSKLSSSSQQHHNPEHHWSRILLCRGHNLDVVGLAWSPDDAYLISCSLDRETPIIVWNTNDLSAGHIPDAHNRLRQPHKILGLGVHTSTVKGVAFDPAGSYFCSSGDDPGLCIWRAHGDYDDWGLEKRIDSTAGIFRTWKEDDTLSMSAQSLFRRISWSTDGSFICSTNSVVKNKHVASTVARQGWSVASSTNSASVGAATLVGHKQPIVVSRHAAYWLDVSKSSKVKSLVTKDDGDENDKEVEEEEEDNDNEEPEYATLLALGDKRGFVTVWSTRKSKPVFKLQCSETRCTVTDLTWGKVNDNHLMLLVSLLDGQVVALQFDILEELGAPLLSDEKQAKVFRLRYGIDRNDNGSGDGGWRPREGRSGGGSQLIENVLQMSLERKAMLDREAGVTTGKKNREDADGDYDDEDAENADENGDEAPPQFSETGDPSVTSGGIKEMQLESQKGGKKRVQPVLVGGGTAGAPVAKRARVEPTPTVTRTATTTTGDALQDAIAAADRAAAVTSATESGKQMAASSQKKHQQASPSPSRQQQQQQIQQTPTTSTPFYAGSGGGYFPRHVLPHRIDRVYSIDLPSRRDVEEASGLTGVCVNSKRLPIGCSKTGTLAAPGGLVCIDLTMNRDGHVVWKDEIPGAACTASSASSKYWAIGTSDGSIQLYGTCASTGWDCGQAFRIMAPLVLGYPIVELQLQQIGNNSKDDEEEDDADDNSKTVMLCITSDGSFFVYNISPQLGLCYKGSVLPAMNHVSLGVPEQPDLALPIPKLSKAQLTKNEQLLLLLSLQRPSSGSSSGRGPSNDASSNRGRSPSQAEDHGAGGSIQGFVYNKSMELWTRMSDSRFVCSDYYQSLPSFATAGRKKKKKIGPLAELDDSVRMGAIGSSLKPARSRPAIESSLIFSSLQTDNDEHSVNFIPTRSHCEDRIACAVQLGSANEAKQWLLRYIRVLILGGHETTLRIVLDMIRGVSGGAVASDKSFVSGAVSLMAVDRADLIRDEILPEIGKNRALQRLANEVQQEVKKK